jgi:selenocysteine lyase/cysteine desulfurase
VHRPAPAEEDARLAAWREDTPGCAERLHLNNAGAALMPRPVLGAIVTHLGREGVLGGYEAADAAHAEIAAAYGSVARVIGARARNVAMVENATVAFAQALSAIDPEPGDTILTSRADYPSNQLMFLSLTRRRGVRLEWAADLPEGGIDPDAVRRRLRRQRVALVSVSWVPTNSGLVQRVMEVGEACAQYGVPYIVDACQAVGQLPIDVQELRCDYLAATARKFLRGPRGAGFLYVSDQALERGDYPLLIDLHAAEWTDPNEFRLASGARRFENWEFAYALVLGQGEAARYALQAGDGALLRASSLAARARSRLAELPGVRVLDRGERLCAIATIAVDEHDVAELKLRLRERGVNVSSFDRSAGVLDMDAKGAASALRFSPHYYNTESEIDEAVERLRELIT